MRSSVISRGMVLAAGLVLAGPALAQMAPAPPSEAADIASCLCLQQRVNTLGADMNGRQKSYREAQEDLARIDAELRSARSGMDVNNPEAVARFRQLVEQRDAAFRRSSGLAGGELARITEHYNASVNEYNARCANRPRDPRLLQSVQATLACPPGY